MKVNILHAVTQGNSRIRRKEQEGGIYTVQKLWLKCHGYASQTTYTVCAKLKTVNSLAFKAL